MLSQAMCKLQIDPLHKFYTTLKQQRPDSEMAKKWYVATSPCLCNQARHRPPAMLGFYWRHSIHGLVKATMVFCRCQPLIITQPNSGSSHTQCSGCAMQAVAPSQYVLMLAERYEQPALCRCLIHGLLDLEEAEQLVAELKLRKGQTRYAQLC
jgi:hypothetical protein